MVSGRTGAVAAASLLAVGVILGVAGLFPAYLGGSSLAQQADQLIPHVIYLAVWTASAVLILLGGARLRLGALLSLGLSVVTFGLFLADAGTAIAGGGTQPARASCSPSSAGWPARRDRCWPSCTRGGFGRFSRRADRGRVCRPPGLAEAAARS